MKALAAGVTCFEVCLFPGDRWSAPVSGSDPELLDFFVCLFVLVFAERVFVFVYNHKYFTDATEALMSLERQYYRKHD